MCENQQSPALQRCGDHARATMNALDESPGRMSRKEQAGQAKHQEFDAARAQRRHFAWSAQPDGRADEEDSQRVFGDNPHPTVVHHAEQLADCQPDRKNREGDTECKSHRSQSGTQ